MTTNDDRNLFEIFAHHMKRDGYDPAASSSGLPPALGGWLGMGALAFGALALFGIIMGNSEDKSEPEPTSANGGSSIGFGMMLATIAVAVAAMVGLSGDKAKARPLPAPAP